MPSRHRELAFCKTYEQSINSVNKRIHFTGEYTDTQRPLAAYGPLSHLHCKLLTLLQIQALVVHTECGIALPSNSTIQCGAVFQVTFNHNNSLLGSTDPKLS